MNKKMIVTLISLFVFFGLIFGWYALKQHFISSFFATFAPPPQAVSTIVAQNVEWQPYLTSVGNMTAIDGVEISPEVSGQVKKIFFSSGEFVKKGQPLIKLDDNSEQAQLADVEAQLQLAKSNLARTQKLFDQKVSTQSSLDDSISKEKQIQANYENISSNISKKLVRAPFDGKIGLKQINVGQFVNAGQICASLQALHALYSKFTLPQKDIRNVALKQKIRVMVDAYPNESFEGYISAIDSKVDENTRTIEIQSTVDNSKEKLYPGMFVTLNVYLPPMPNTVVIPQSAVTFTLYGDSAFVVTLDGKKDAKDQDTGVVKRVFIKTGDRQNNNVVILEGVKPGDILVNSGQSKLEDGSKVVINNSNPL